MTEIVTPPDENGGSAPRHLGVEARASLAEALALALIAAADALPDVSAAE